MGVGQALLEEIALEEGNNLTTLFANYLIPTSLDVPDVRPIVLESGEGKGPFNARGIGEPPTGPPPAAIASAVGDAIGIRPLELPIAAERLFNALEARRTGPDGKRPPMGGQER
jgi:CO/xanthine dehydrogenase Mo-binding subunit